MELLQGVVSYVASLIHAVKPAETNTLYSFVSIEHHVVETFLMSIFFFGLLNGM